MFVVYNSVHPWCCNPDKCKCRSQEIEILAVCLDVDTAVAFIIEYRKTNLYGSEVVKEVPYFTAEE